MYRVKQLMLLSISRVWHGVRSFTEQAEHAVTRGKAQCVREWRGLAGYYCTASVCAGPAQRNESGQRHAPALSVRAIW